MQVAMRLGPYWWKKLWQKEVYNSIVRKCTLLGTSLLTAATILWLGLTGLVGIEKYRSSAEDVKTLYDIIFILAAGSGLLGTIYLAGVSVTFVKSLIATFRFRTIFGFSPPVTAEGHKVLESTIRYMLAIRAHSLDEVYEREKRMLENIKKKVAHCVNIWNWLQNVGASVTSIENDLGNLEKEKKREKKGFYSARDAARNPFLPLPYDKSQLPDSYKEYLQ